jgi:hypothetical protein
VACETDSRQQIPKVKEMIDNPCEWLLEWSDQIGAEPKGGLREAPSWIALRLRRRCGSSAKLSEAPRDGIRMR